MPFNWFGMMKLVRKLSKSLDVKIVWTIHNLLPHNPRYGSFEKDKEAMRYMAEWADVGIVHSERTKEEFYEMFDVNLPLYVIPHGNFNEYVKIIPSEVARNKLRITEDKIVLFILSPDRWVKGIKTFIEVVNQLPTDYLGLIAGRCKDPEIKRYILNAIKKDPKKFIVDLRYLSSEEVSYYFGAADIFFMPYERITTSGSVMFALAHKKPIISTPQGNLYMLVKNGVNGYLCNTKEEMIERILSIDRNTAKKMGEKSYEIAAQYDWKNITKETIKIYNKVLGNF